MKTLLSLAGATLVLLAISAVAAASGDGEWLSPPPEAVAESFFRALATERFPRARPYLSETLRSQMPVSSLESYLRQSEEQIGRIEDVAGRTGRISGNGAEASVELETERGVELVTCRLVRENCVWKIAQLPTFAPAR